MSTVMRGSARATSAVAALLLVILSFGLAGAAYADPGNGNGNDGSNPGNANGADNGNGADDGNGADNGNGAVADTGGGAPSDTAGAAVAAAASSASSAKSDSSNSSSAKSSSGKGSSAKGTGSGSTKGSSGAKSASDHKTKGTAGTSGSPNSPQPISGADDNSGGANGQCPGGVYCSTRNGSASGNGNGGGKAVGKPCAGCVGKADNKNPKGQMPGPQDHNNGYECDGNNGIAKTNPAHTGCKPGTPPCVGAGCNPPPPCVGAGCNPPPPPCVGAGCNPPPPPCVGAGCNPPPPVVCPEGAVLVDGVCVFGEDEILCPDGSVMPPNGKCEEAQPPTVLGEEAFRPPVKVQAAPAGVLPATGSSSGLGLLAGLGFTMTALGAGVMMRRRTV